MLMRCVSSAMSILLVGTLSHGEVNGLTRVSEWQSGMETWSPDSKSIVTTPSPKQSPSFFCFQIFLLPELKKKKMGNFAPQA